MVATLEKLARDKSAEGRYELLLQLSDYVQTNTANLGGKGEENLLAIVEHVLEDLEPETRVQFTTKAATFDWLPNQLAVMLANREFNTARPVIEATAALTDADLLEIARKRGLAYRQAIARRSELAERVIDQLVELGEEKVFQELIRNEKLKKSANLYRKIIENSRGMRALQEELMMSPQVPNKEYDMLGKVLDGSLRLRYVAQKNKRKAS